MTYEVQIKKVPIKVGCMSLVGIYGQPPHSFGNYFDLPDWTRVYNMWAENFKAADKTFNLNNEILVKLYTWTDNKGCIVIDDRIPEEWLYNKCCYTGGFLPPLEVARDIYETLGDPHNEFERFTDPKSYYSKRGGSYDEKTGTIRYTIKSSN